MSSVLPYLLFDSGYELQHQPLRTDRHKAHDTMAKTKAAKRKSTATWTGADHSSRTAARIASLQKKQRKKQEKLLARDSISNEEQQHLPHEPQPPAKKRKRGRLSSHIPNNTYKRSHLAHDNQDKIDLSKLRLATSQIQRQLSILKQRLENWDTSDPTNDVIIVDGPHGPQVATSDREDIKKRMELDAMYRRGDIDAREKAKREMMIIEAERGVNSSIGRRKGKFMKCNIFILRTRNCEYIVLISIVFQFLKTANLRKKPRPGPETWKLRGAARPAWEVYDFDTRYVDPHMKALEAHKEKMQRSVNVLSVCRGRFAEGTSAENDKQGSSDKLFKPPQPHCRTYLSLLTQLGSLHLSRKNYSSARSSLLEAIELEGYDSNSITNARYQLMNMYLATNRPSAARKLWNMLPSDSSAWIRYSAALIEYVSWNILGEDGSTQHVAEKALGDAIRGNVYVAYYLGWKDMFDKAMEYTADVVEYGDGNPGSIMEAVEYYGCGDMEEEDERGLAMWLGTEGSTEWVRSFILRVMNSTDNYMDLKAILSKWETKLVKEEEYYVQEQESDSGNDEQGEEEKEERPDLLMYSGMFRTAMDWLQDAGEFIKSPTERYIRHIVEENEREDAPNYSIVEEDEVQSTFDDCESDVDSEESDKN